MSQYAGRNQYQVEDLGNIQSGVGKHVSDRMSEHGICHGPDHAPWPGPCPAPGISPGHGHGHSHGRRLGLRPNAGEISINQQKYQYLQGKTASKGFRPKAGKFCFLHKSIEISISSKENDAKRFPAEGRGKFFLHESSQISRF